MPAKRQIVTFGGGGFSMEAGNPLLDEFVLQLTGRVLPRVCFLPQASGDDGPLHRPLLSCLFGGSLPAVTPVALPSPALAARAPQAPARPGPDLRRRRQRQEPAWRLARPRHRPHPGRGLDRGVVLAASPQARSAGSPKARARFTARRSGLRGWAFCHGATLCITRASTIDARPITAGCAKGCERDMPPTTGRPCTSSVTSLLRSLPRAHDARGYRVECRAGRVVTTQLATRYLGNGEAIPLVRTAQAEGAPA